LFDIQRPLSHAWRWTVAYDVASSGYPVSCHVTATKMPSDEGVIGTAACAVTTGDDLSEVIECLAIEAMLAACEPTLDGSPPHRRVVFSTNL
jgi:hypothetical protein